MNASSSRGGRVFNRLAAARVDRGWGRGELAELAGCHTATIGRIERYEYEPSLGLALRLAAAFDCRVEDLFALDSFPLITESR
jgi:putative transcriptional regulator